MLRVTPSLNQVVHGTPLFQNVDDSCVTCCVPGAMHGRPRGRASPCSRSCAASAASARSASPISHAMKGSMYFRQTM